MSVCTRCKLEREESQYDRYWHSTRQKFFVRKICNPCMREAYKQYKLKVKQKNLIENNPDYKQCSVCMDYKSINDFYLSSTKTPIRKCKICFNLHNKNRVQEKLNDRGGAINYYKEPDRYTSEIQREQVFMFMELLGWQYTINENGPGVWNKPGLKENGIFINIIPKVKKIKKRPAVPHGRKINQKVWGSMETIVKLKEEGYTYKEIAEEYECSQPTIMSVIKKYRDEKRTN